MRQKLELETQNETTNEVISACSEQLLLYDDLIDVYTPTVRDVRNSQNRPENDSTKIGMQDFYCIS